MCYLSAPYEISDVCDNSTKEMLEEEQSWNDNWCNIKITGSNFKQDYELYEKAIKLSRCRDSMEKKIV